RGFRLPPASCQPAVFSRWSTGVSFRQKHTSPAPSSRRTRRLPKAKTPARRGRYGAEDVSAPWGHLTFVPRIAKPANGELSHRPRLGARHLPVGSRRGRLGRAALQPARRLPARLGEVDDLILDHL